MDSLSWLIALTLTTIRLIVAGTTVSSPTDVGGSLNMLDVCEHEDFFDLAMDRCRQLHGQPSREDYPWNFLGFVDSFGRKYQKQSCQQELHQLAKLFRCNHEIYGNCFQLFLKDGIENDDEESILFFQDLHLYEPDPDLVDNALNDICQLTEEDWSCASEGMWKCGELESSLEKTEYFARTGQTDKVKPYTCRVYSEFRLCTEKVLKHCPANQQAMVSRIVNNIIPPACIKRGFAEIDQGQTEKDPETIHYN